MPRFPHSLIWWKRKQWSQIVQPRVTNTAKRRQRQCAKFTPVSYL
ncbi:hypothetical protein UUU_13700 [Klebsiella pneumoniae subsp. pneumoniae DSM 30104 = JCM 1662 = NBRC 14940]|nr:hypothetical protein UUU_13700 [Klebsiella pneumoniae subsp. pneumoniae DSM 30104 = JCM 1662 = NBRC 14940]